MSVAQRERAALVETLRTVGPDAPTLCTGWTTRDLTAHLVLREYRPDAAPGIVVSALAGYTARVQDRIAADTDWEALLARFAAGPPLYSPFKLLDAVANVNEMFVHHEDVRRAVPGWAPRVLDAESVAALRKSVPVFSRVAMSKVPARLTLRTPDGATVATVGHGPDLTLTAAAPELLLFAYGRNEIQGDFAGADDGDADDDVVAAVRAADRGI